MAPTTGHDAISQLPTNPNPPFTLEAALQSFSLIIFSEIGDKTFLIAAILAMRHPRLVVFLGAFGSLAVMSLLSAEVGHLLPTLVPKRWTQLAAAVLFVVFGAKMGWEAWGMEGGDGKIKEEMREAEEEIEGDEEGGQLDWEEEEGNGEERIVLEVMVDSPKERLESEGEEEVVPSPTSRTKRKTKANKAKSWAEGARNFCSLFLGPVFVQAFVLTFLGEWGDRSQIATIALGAAHNVYLVTLGTIVGHSCCTALAVVGGRYVSTKISVKHVTYGGSILFLLFGMIYFYQAISMSSEMEIPMELDADGP
ncbi:hypothetical protein AMATHDRAFT_71770 [Amanita thiersii Skay4041]|uniref:GDT1 family protein n=1 Tax=Amanita thiersii Skay4041 TaxID=703135 RepID=A0A2A9NCP1_9AGAR|nr:hypothetical protein AMATHDRAFT_71770 [Amanita thiersii Skay4041]